jgi:hypothetical protein
LLPYLARNLALASVVLTAAARADDARAMLNATA